MEENILNRLKNTISSDEAQTIINEALPGWLVVSFDSYSPDYPHLQSNWRIICNHAKTTPKKIVLVSDFEFKDTPTLKNKLCEYMTANGYCVRRLEEFVPCKVCNKAIPCEEIWRQFLDRKLDVPKTWSDKCKNC
jgi:hypothetical protein